VSVTLGAAPADVGTASGPLVNVTAVGPPVLGVTDTRIGIVSSAIVSAPIARR
jgi:hypothetical protein